MGVGKSKIMGTRRRPGRLLSLPINVPGRNALTPQNLKIQSLKNPSLKIQALPLLPVLPLLEVDDISSSSSGGGPTPSHRIPGLSGQNSNCGHFDEWAREKKNEITKKELPYNKDKLYKKVLKTEFVKKEYKACMPLKDKNQTLAKEANFKRSEMPTHRFTDTELEDRVLWELLIDHFGNFLVNLEPGNYFGERALFSSARRTATIISKTPCKFAVIESKDYHRILVHIVRDLEKLKAKFLNYIFGDISLLSRNKFSKLIYVIGEGSGLEHEILTKEGRKGSYIYIVFSGECDLFKKFKQNDYWKYWKWKVKSTQLTKWFT
jgi:hypothetical protein